ncbi:hypothetical protein GCM10010103_09960 [Streptomyces paradoxus]
MLWKHGTEFNSEGRKDFSLVRIRPWSGFVPGSGFDPDREESTGGMPEITEAHSRWVLQPFMCAGTKGDRSVS